MDPAIAMAKVAMADFTKQMVQSIDRATYYEPGHPAHYALGSELYHELVKLLADQPQIGYLLQRGMQPEVFVDGLPSGRVRLSELYTPGLYELFVPRFIAYFDRYELVALAFRTGLTAEEFEKFVTVMSRPKPKQGDERIDLPQVFLDQGVLHISVLSSDDVHLDEDLPWQVRICLARLRRDLRTVPFFRDAPPEVIRKVKQQIFSDIVRPLAAPDQIKSLVLYGPRIEKDVASVEGLDAIQVAPAIVSALQHPRLCALTDLLVKELADGTAVQNHLTADLTSALFMCTRRLLSEDVQGAEGTLRLLYQQDVVELEELPNGLQEWLLAEDLRDQLAAGQLGELPSGTEREVRILGKLAHLTLQGGDYATTNRMVEYLKRLSSSGQFQNEVGAALEGIVSAEGMAQLTEKIEASSKIDVEGILQLLRLLELRGALALAGQIVRSGENARFGNCYHALDAMGELAAMAIADALARPELKAPVVRVLFALAVRHPSSRLSEEALKYTAHAQPMVRLAALSAAAARPNAQILKVVKAALDDPAPEVVEFALSALAERLGAAEQAREHALKLLKKPTPTTPTSLLVAAVATLGKYPGDGEDRLDTIDGLRDFLDKEKRGGFLGFGQKQAHPQAVEAAQQALAGLDDGTDGGGGQKRSRLRDLFMK